MCNELEGKAIHKEHVYIITAMLNVPKDNKTNKTSNLYFDMLFQLLTLTSSKPKIQLH